LPKWRKSTTGSSPIKFPSRAASPLRGSWKRPARHEHAPRLCRMWDRRESLADFGGAFATGSHLAGSRPGAGRTIDSGGAARLAERFTEGLIADAWLAPTRTSLAGTKRQPCRNGRLVQGAWPCRRGLRRHAWLAALALIRSPLPFARRNLFTHRGVALEAAGGRPSSPGTKSAARTAERQRRFRKRRQRELAELRSLMRSAGHKSTRSLSHRTRERSAEPAVRFVRRDAFEVKSC